MFLCCLSAAAASALVLCIVGVVGLLVLFAGVWVHYICTVCSVFAVDRGLLLLVVLAVFGFAGPLDICAPKIGASVIHWAGLIGAPTSTLRPSERRQYSYHDMYL